MTKILDGKKVAAEIQRGLRMNDRKSTLSVFRVGEDGGSIAYENAVKKICEEFDIKTRLDYFTADSDESEIIAKIKELNKDKKIGGVLLLKPFPKNIDGERIVDALAPIKDLDGVTGRGFPPCTAEAVIRMLDYYGVKTAGKRAVVIGRSKVIGKPAAMLLVDRDATVTICHSKTKNLSEIARHADILVAATGNAESVGREYMNENQVVIDVGTSFVSGSLKGDVKFSEANGFVRALSPVPGGIGSITKSILLEHLMQRAK
jgi:methylenetetrahydrofolate dehydrogenase (NADP+)/methenyltetrahydrofolate cyclohydrolase